MRVNRFLMPIMMIVALLGTTFIAQAAGFWSTSGKDSTNLENMTAADIKGWMTLQQVMDSLQISKEDLYAAGGIPLDVPTETALKDLEGIVPDFEISTLRDKLAVSANSIEPLTTSETLAPIGPMPLPQPTATPMPVSTLTHASSIMGTQHTGDSTGTGPTPLPPGQALPADQIKGRMTLREVSDQCAVPFDQLLVALNLPSNTRPHIAIKDLVSQGAFGEVTAVQDAVAKLQTK